MRLALMAMAASLAGALSPFAECATQRSGDWENLDFLARGTPGFAVTSVTAGALGAPLTGLVVETRTLIGAELGASVNLGNHHAWQLRAGAGENRIITAVGLSRADGPVRGIALETAPLPEGVALGEPSRSGTPGEPDVFLRAPEGHHIIGVGAGDGEGNLRQIGVTVAHLAPENFKPTPAPDGYRTIYVSGQSGDDRREGRSPDQPIRTLHRAKELAKADASATGFRILLRGGETFTPEKPMRNELMDRRNQARGRYALMWDLPKGLILSTYGSGHLAGFGPGGYTSDPEAVQGAICVVRPANQPILIENLHFRHWQIEVLYTLAYLPDGKDQLIFRRNLVEKQGAKYFPGETAREGNHPFYTGGTLQPRSSRNLLVEENIFRDIHNRVIDGKDPVYLDRMHVFYFGRTGDSVVRGNVVQNTSGPPFKVRARDASNIDLVNNAFYYAVPSRQLNLVQEGWLRVSTTAGGDDWPENLRIRGNFFYHPFCAAGLEDCATADTVQYTVARRVDWSGAVWEENRFIFTWE